MQSMQLSQRKSACLPTYLPTCVLLVLVLPPLLFLGLFKLIDG